VERNPELNAAQRPGEGNFDLALRPKGLGEFIGQEGLKENLAVFLRAALDRGEPLDHVLLYGPPGLGKTTLAHIVAQEMGTMIHVTSGPAIARAGDLVGILTNLEPGAVLFIDEIHRLNRAVEEILYPAMEDRRVDILLGQGPGARSIRLDVPPFTLVGATTRQGLITGPLRDRFGIVFHLEYYTATELERVLIRSARLLGYELARDGAEAIARRSRGTPRIANRLLRRVRDFAQVSGETMIHESAAGEALERLQVDLLGLDRVDRLFLGVLIEKFGGGPTGVETLAAAMGEDPGTIEDVCEPYLMQIGFLQRTPRGRMATAAAFAHLRIPRPDGSDLGG